MSAFGVVFALAGCGGDDTAAGGAGPDGSAPVDATTTETGADGATDAATADAGVDGPDVGADAAPVDAGIDACTGITCGAYCCTATAPSTVACSDPGQSDNRCLITLAAAVGTGQVAVGGGYVYFLSNEGTPGTAIERVPAGGGAVQTIVTDQHISGYGSAFAIDANNVYWVDEDTEGGQPNGTVMQAPLAGGPATTLVTGQTSPIAIGVNAAGVYWLDWREVLDPDAGPLGDTGIVMTLGADGGASVVAAAPGPPKGLALNATTAFWLANGNGTLGTVYSAALAGGGDGGATLVATNQSNPTDLAVNALTLAWTNESTNVFLTGGSLVVQPLEDGGFSAQTNGSAGIVTLDVSDVLYSVDTGGANGVTVSNLISLHEGTILTDMQNVQGLAVDATSVYISDAFGIRQLTPR